MAGEINAAHTFVDGESVSAATLNSMQLGLRVADGAISTTKVADGAVTAAKLDPTLALSAGQIGLTSGKILLGNGSNVGTAGTVGTTLGVTGSTLDIATGGVGTTQLAANAVTTAKITDANVTLAKIVNTGASKLLGNATGSAAAPAEIGLGSGLAFAAGLLTATGSGTFRVAGWSQLTSPVSFVGSTFADSGLSLTITPLSSSSKFIVFAVLNAGADGLGVGACFRLTRNGSSIDVPTSPGSRFSCGGMTGLSANGNNFTTSVNLLEYDQPTTASAITYKVQGMSLAGGVTTAYLNRAYDDDNDALSARAVSSLLVIEIP